MPVAAAPIAPRLLDLHGAAFYLSVSEWTVRDLVASGKLPRVRLAVNDAKELRKLLFDREDLDRVIGESKEESTP